MNLKHTLFLLLCALAVAGGVALAVVTHRDAVKQQTLQTAQQTATQADEAKAIADAKAAVTKASLQLTKDEATIKKLQAQCQLGLNAYNDMTSYAKARMVKPDCSL